MLKVHSISDCNQNISYSRWNQQCKQSRSSRQIMGYLNDLKRSVKTATDRIQSLIDQEQNHQENSGQMLVIEIQSASIAVEFNKVIASKDKRRIYDFVFSLLNRFNIWQRNQQTLLVQDKVFGKHEIHISKESSESAQLKKAYKSVAQFYHKLQTLEYAFENTASKQSNQRQSFVNKGDNSDQYIHDDEQCDLDQYQSQFFQNIFKSKGNHVNHQKQNLKQENKCEIKQREQIQIKQVFAQQKVLCDLEAQKNVNTDLNFKPNPNLFHTIHQQLPIDNKIQTNIFNPFSVVNTPKLENPFTQKHIPEQRISDIQKNQIPVQNKIPYNIFATRVNQSMINCHTQNNQIRNNPLVKLFVRALSSRITDLSNQNTNEAISRIHQCTHTVDQSSEPQNNTSEENQYAYDGLQDIQDPPE